MNQLDVWLTETAANLAKEPEHAAECDGLRCTCGYVPSVLDQRIALGLLQARALECRELANNLRMSGLTLKHQIAADFAQVLSMRSHMLEQRALQLCDQWPPSDMPAEETCDCNHTISQHSQRDGVHGPCSTCGCKGYQKRQMGTIQ